MLPKHTILAFFSDVDLMLASFEEKRQARAGEEEDASRLVGWVAVEKVQVVKLADTLINAATNATECDNITSSRLIITDPVDRFPEIGGFLVMIVDDGGWGRL